MYRKAVFYLCQFIEHLNNNAGLITALAALITAVATCILAFLTCILSREAVVQGQIIAADERPWIANPKFDPSCDISPQSGIDEPSLPITISFKNAGKTVASHFFVEVHFSTDADPNLVAHNMCATAEKIFLGNQITVVPSDEYFGNFFHNEDLRSVRAVDIMKGAAPFIAGCAIYGSTLDIKRVLPHKTVFFAKLKKRGVGFCLEKSTDLDSN